MRRLVRVVLLAFAFAVPWQYSLEIGEPIGNIARVVGLVLLAVAVPAILLGGRLHATGPAHWLVLSLFLWLCCTCFWTIDERATLTSLRAFFQVMMPFWLVWEFVDSPSQLRDLMRALVAGSWILALLTVANFASLDATAQFRFVAEGQDPNDVARFLDFGFPLSALLLESESGWLWKWIAIGYLPVGLVAVLLTASRGGFLAALVALAGCGLVLARRHPRAVVAGAASLPVISALFWGFVPHETLTRIVTIPEQLQRGDLNQRLNIWSAGWQAFLYAPFFGSGAGTFIQAARLAPIDTAHNTALSLAVAGGVVALIFASALVALCIRSVLGTSGSVRLALGTALVVWLVTSMVATVETNRTTWLLLGIFALAARLGSEEPELMEACFGRNSARGALSAPAQDHA
jgi:O-antigen ligase